MTWVVLRGEELPRTAAGAALVENWADLVFFIAEALRPLPPTLDVYGGSIQRSFACSSRRGDIHNMASIWTTGRAVH